METEVKTPAKPRDKKIKRVFILFTVIAISSYFAITKYLYNTSHEETDNAQLEGNILPIASRVYGYVDSLAVEDNKAVKKGDLLVKLDDREFILKVKQAEAALQNAESGYEIQRAFLDPLQANISTNGSQIKNAEVRIWKAEQDYKRIKNLFAVNASTQQQYDAAKAEYDASLASLAIIKNQLEASRSQLDAESTKLKSLEITIRQKKIELETAQLNLSYTRIVSPVNGIISKRNVQQGQYVQVGNPMFAITLSETPWVVANFKETQSSKIKKDMPVKVEVDAYPGVEFDGVVETISPATGSRFSLLPADNASGNFVKITQRIPVKILVTNYDKEKYNLRAGMSCLASVDIR